MYETSLKINLEGFIKYLDGLGASTTDEDVKRHATDAVGLLNGVVAKLDGGTFSKADARDLQGMLTKGIGDWAWPVEVAKEIDRHTTDLCVLAYAEEIS